MSKFTRRTFNKGLGATVALGALTLPGSAPFAASHQAQVVIIGGGFGGATAAKYIKRFNHKISVTLIEPSKNFITCPFSNTIIGGINDISYITKNYNALKDLGVKVIHDMGSLIDGAGKKVKLVSGGSIGFDRCIVSPG
ncbi:MAG: FAD-dependent oxidoreductase, partial [Rhodospirillales bacterium]|nr:FAD-dependent oxidoreductase [Rhodospirillales bacterium]